MADLIIGYGSLIGPDKRERAGHSRMSYRVHVEGYARRWNVKASNKKTYLGVVTARSSVMNAVLFPVTGEDLVSLDEREGAYDRCKVDVGRVHGPMPRRSTIWIYVPKAEWVRDEPDPGYAVKRSYVDVVVLGCLAFGRKFCDEFIATTEQWEQYWFANRKIEPELATTVDALVGHFYPAEREVATRLPPRRHGPVGE